MKISIGINNYKRREDLNDREKMCIDSLLKLKSMYKEVELVNLMFEDEKFASLEDFVNLSVLKKIPSDITTKKIPFVNEIFDILSERDSDFFIFINNDILVSNRFIKTILANKTYDCFPASKLHFMKLSSIDDKNSEPQSLSVHGFDGFGIRNKWWRENSFRFSNLLLGSAYWDTYFFAKCRLYGRCMTLNKPPCVIFHLDHKSSSMDQDTENNYNEKMFVQDPDNLPQRWYSYVQNVLLKRPTYNNILWYIIYSQSVERCREKSHIIIITITFNVLSIKITTLSISATRLLLL